MPNEYATTQARLEAQERLEARRYREELERLTREREAAAQFEWTRTTAIRMPTDDVVVYNTPTDHWQQAATTNVVTTNGTYGGINVARRASFDVRWEYGIGEEEQAKEEEVSFLEGLETKETK